MYIYIWTKLVTFEIIFLNCNRKRIYLHLHPGLGVDLARIRSGLWSDSGRIGLNPSLKGRTKNEKH